MKPPFFIILIALVITSSHVSHSQTRQTQDANNRGNNIQIGTARDVNIRQRIQASVGRITEESISELDCDIHKEFVEQLFGKPKIVIPLEGFDQVTYVRYSNKTFDIQIIYTSRNTVGGYRIYRNDGEKRSLEDEVGNHEPQKAWIGGDAKFPSYVEKHYFGRPYYNYYYNASIGDLFDQVEFPDGVPWMSSEVVTGLKLDRSKIRVHSVFIERFTPKGVSEDEWDEFLSYFVGVHPERFEE